MSVAVFQENITYKVKQQPDLADGPQFADLYTSVLEALGS